MGISLVLDRWSVVEDTIEPGRVVRLPRGVAILEVLEEESRRASRVSLSPEICSRSMSLEGLAFVVGRRRGGSFWPGRGGRAKGFSPDLLRTFEAMLFLFRPRAGYTGRVLIERCEACRVGGLGLFGICASEILGCSGGACWICRDDLSFMISSHDAASFEAMMSNASAVNNCS